ncbi:MAG TPA: hypothetical protein VER14_08125 [Phototrophicaceae bacterium]|nr:hypothetical protein [Phototrophicaceae bacterium]
MTSIRNANIKRHLLEIYSTTYKNNKGVSLFAFALAFALASQAALSLCNLNAQAQAQEYGTPAIADHKVFTVIVQVTNNAYTDEEGAIHVYIDGTDISKVLNGVVCPAESTIDYTFDFDSDDIPVGKGFTAEMVYGDDVIKRTYGVNSPSKAPEVAQIAIP